jgi:hypothetical protein
VIAFEGVKSAGDGLKAEDDGNIVGREGPRRDVKVLESVSWSKISGRSLYTSLQTPSTPASPLSLTQLKLLVWHLSLRNSGDTAFRSIALDHRPDIAVVKLEICRRRQIALADERPHRPKKLSRLSPKTIS